MFSKKIFLVFLLFGTAACAQEITAKSWLLADVNGHILQAEQQDKIRSIASITKLMTVLVTLDQTQNLNRLVSVQRDPAVRGKIPRNVKQITISELIELSLVSSDNLAALNLCRSYNNNKKKTKEKYPCVKAMNQKAKELGMTKTVFVEPTGLNKKNVSTAEDLVKLVQAAANYSVVLENSDKRFIQLKTAKTDVRLKNTNPLIGEQHHILVSKTGWTYAAGGCIVMLMNTDHGHRIIVVLGSKSTKTRIPEAELIAKLPINIAESTVPVLNIDN